MHFNCPPSTLKTPTHTLWVDVEQQQQKHQRETPGPAVTPDGVRFLLLLVVNFMDPLGRSSPSHPLIESLVRLLLIPCPTDRLPLSSSIFKHSPAMLPAEYIVCPWPLGWVGDRVKSIGGHLRTGVRQEARKSAVNTSTREPNERSTAVRTLYVGGVEVEEV